MSFISPQMRQSELFATEESFPNDHLLENLSEYQSFVKNNKRTQLHNRSTVGWLKSRYPQKAKKNYLLFPEELVEDMKIRKIFKIFDKDNSKALDLKEMVEMFQKYNIEIDKEELQQIYDIVDKTKDNALNYYEFKECAISQDANSIFSKMITKVREFEQSNKTEDERNIYLPQRFAEMVTYLSYRINRDDLEQYLKERSHRISEKYEKYLQLMNLNGLDSAGATAHENTKKDKQKLDKASDLEQKIFDRQEESDEDDDDDNLSQANSVLNRSLRNSFAGGVVGVNAATSNFNEHKPSLFSASNPPTHREAGRKSPVANSYFVLAPQNAVHRNTHQSNSRSSFLQNSGRNSMLHRDSLNRSDDDTIFLPKSTKIEAQLLSRKAAESGSQSAKHLYEQTVSKNLNFNSFRKDTKQSFTTTNKHQQQQQQQQSFASTKQTLVTRSSRLLDPIAVTKTSESSRSQLKKEKLPNLSPFRVTNQSLRNNQQSSETKFRITSKYSDDRFFKTEYTGQTSDQTNESLNKFRNTCYTLGKRKEVKTPTPLEQLGIDRASFKNMNSIMNRTLIQLNDSKSEQKPSMKGLQKSQIGLLTQSSKLLTSPPQSHIIDSKWLRQGGDKVTVNNDYHEREQQLIADIKSDILEKFLKNSKEDAIIVKQKEQNLTSVQGNNRQNSRFSTPTPANINPKFASNNQFYQSFLVN